MLKGEYTKFIPQNTAPNGAKKIALRREDGSLAGYVGLSYLAEPQRGEKLYSFGALSDVHIGEQTADEDFKRALTYLSANTNFICICGDLVHGGTDAAPAQIETYKSIVSGYATKPVYAIPGNHDGAYVPDWWNSTPTYTGKPLYYSFVQGNDVFIMVGNKSTGQGALFTVDELQWLYETLEANRNKRCFVFQHVRPDDACGNALGIYKTDDWGGTEQAIFESLLRHYPNIVLFHGHSHLRLHMQEYSRLANYDKSFGCHSIHIPSISVPRDTLSVVNPSITTIYAESEGYIVDVYPNGIHLRGRDFVKGEFLPIASYWLDTTLHTVEPGTYTDPTGTIATGR